MELSDIDLEVLEQALQERADWLAETGKGYPHELDRTRGLLDRVRDDLRQRRQG